MPCMGFFSSGWKCDGGLGGGVLLLAGLMTTRLQKADVQVIREQDCRSFYPIQISSRMLCAGFPQGAIDSCSVSPRRVPTTGVKGEFGPGLGGGSSSSSSAPTAARNGHDLQGMGEASPLSPPPLALGCRAVTLPSCSAGRCGWPLGLQRAVWPLVPGRHHQLGLRLRPAFLPRGLCQGDSSPGLDCTEPQGVTPYPLGLAGGAHKD